MTARFVGRPTTKATPRPSYFVVIGLDYAADWIDALRKQLKDAGITPNDPS